ncbi:hypothetical protein K505DRAFT_328498 [Melanomma pulvis-pyrius CBS 109.77]|uniref:Protein kinase domain-containing protein n=1 Tax=Melanomma pulvis-pyrius CBS 109.77 TaxID=1314802 RepID=A0A6A6WYA3_9PLEO|nr:hypothetical protein K505DRAFT_328498 [Melanomma pulvis-pyrius CBS 109.77]
MFPESPPFEPDSEISDSDDGECGLDVKPDFPYKLGVTFIAKRHIPPAPFGNRYINGGPPVQEGWKELSQTAYCLSRPPLEGFTDEHDTLPLKITSVIRASYDCGAQVIIVNEDKVAKIFDPLYYRGLSDYSYKNDVVINADGDYCCEAVAYTELQKSPEAMQCTPKYYGSWTIEVDTYVGRQPQGTMHKRQVRLLLLEFVDGECMRDIEAIALRKKARSNILTKVLEADALIYHAGIHHRDIHPRNIIVIGADYESPDMHVKILDFNISRVQRLTKDYKYTADFKEKLLSEWPSKILSPIPRYWGNMSDFWESGWISKEKGECEKWLWKHFHGKRKYVPLKLEDDGDRKRPVPVGWDEIVKHT